MILSNLPVTRITPVADDTYSIRFHSPELARSVQPGQFVNILTDQSFDPLLRRPYSISDVQSDECEILFAVVGKGTAILARKRPGDLIGILGPLGNTFGFGKDFATALIVAGGIGVAPFPLLTSALRARGRRILSFVGARSATRLVLGGLDEVHVATDDGSEGFHGTVVECLEWFLSANAVDAPRIFACGPNPMLSALRSFALEQDIPCELSLESEMACGIGICQGCPVERCDGDRKYALVCAEGPCFDAREIQFQGHGAT